MSRVKRGVTSRAKHKKLLESNKGYRGTKSKLVKVAKEAFLHAGHYAYVGRKNRKRDMRQAWILKIGEAAKLNGISYSQLMNGLKKANIILDRKSLAQLVMTDTEGFKAVVAKAKTFAFTPSK